MRYLPHPTGAWIGIADVRPQDRVTAQENWTACGLQDYCTGRVLLSFASLPSSSLPKRVHISPKGTMALAIHHSDHTTRQSWLATYDPAEETPTSPSPAASQNATCKGHIVYQDFTFLIPSHAHAALMSKNVRRDLPVRFRRLRLHRAFSTDSIYLRDFHTDHPFRPVACSGGSPAAAG